MSAHTNICDDCGNGTGLNSRVYLCPLHAAAPRMLAFIVNYVNSCEQMSEARAILRDVEGESNG